MGFEDDKPLYSITVAAELSNATPRMLREYEKAGLIKPARVNTQRRFSNNDIQFIKNIRFYLEEAGMTIAGLKILYKMAPCWEVKQCGATDCAAYGEYTKKCWELAELANPDKSLSCAGCPVRLTREHGSGFGDGGPPPACAMAGLIPDAD